MSEEPITVVLADDHAMVRTGLRMILDSASGIDVVAEAEDIESTLRKLRAYRPRVLVLDLNMHGASSLPSLPEIAEASPESKVIVLTMEVGTSYAREALRAGADGYLLKDAAEGELVEAIRTVAGGGPYVQPAIGARIASEPDEIWPPDGLSEREVEVLRLIARGHTNKEISDQLHLSVRTVESHRAHIQQKLGLQTRAELVGYALDHKMISA